MALFTFDPISQRYRGEKGRYISPASVRAIIDDDIAATKDRMQALARDLQSGKLDSDGFQSAMVQEIKDLHIAQVAVARGGADRMNQAAYGRCGGILKREFRYLNEFVKEIEADPTMTGTDAFINRVGLYADSGVSSYEAQRLIEMKDAEFQSMQNVLEPGAHHCEGDNSCPAMDKLGRVAIDDARFLLPGQRACIVRCKCSVKYFKAALAQ